MARRKVMLDIDCLTAARQRMREAYERFDNVVVCFSGGKDSLAVLHLAREAAQEAGQAKVKVIFRDEELIPDEVVDFVDHYRRLPWVDMHWFAVPLASNKYIMGVSHSYVQWDPARRHVREVPPWAITLPAGDTRVLDQYTADGFIYEALGLRGSAAFCTGIRASESLIRFRSIVNKVNEPHISGSGCAAVRIFKPIYDWAENDVFRYFYDNGIRYCPIYDMQMWSGVGLRVSTPLHSEASKRFDLLKRFAPRLYAGIIEVFPEMLHHERYYRDIDQQALKRRYADTMDGIWSWCEENLPDDVRAKARERFLSIKAMRENDPEAYPLDAVFKYFTGGTFKRGMLPVPKHLRRKNAA